MATNPRSTVTERIGPALVSRRRRATQRKSSSLKGRLVRTGVALVVLVLVWRYLPPGGRSAQAYAPAVAVSAAPSDLHFSDLQMSRAAGGEGVYVDGLVANQGNATVTGVTAEVEFRDSQGHVIADVEKPLVGVAHGGTDLARNEFARNPMTPNAQRFFRVAVEQAPAQWNHAVPELKIVAIKEQ